jgi:hypothetical protein
MSHGKHLKYMVLAGAAVLGLLILTGVSLSSALPYALALACPLMMVFMMATMNHSHSDHHAPAIPTPTAPENDLRQPRPPR